MKLTRRVLGDSLLCLLVRLHRLLSHSGAHGKEVFVYGMKASISYSFNPLYIVNVVYVVCVFVYMVCFCCASQKAPSPTMPLGSTEELRSRLLELLNKSGKRNGGMNVRGEIAGPLTFR